MLLLRGSILPNEVTDRKQREPSNIREYLWLSMGKVDFLPYLVTNFCLASWQDKSAEPHNSSPRSQEQVRIGGRGEETKIARTAAIEDEWAVISTEAKRRLSWSDVAQGIRNHC